MRVETAQNNPALLLQGSSLKVISMPHPAMVCSRRYGSAPRRAAALVVALAACFAAPAQVGAQGARPAAEAPAPGASLPGAGGAAGAAAGVPAGAGAGYHSPSSPIAPLPQRNDVVPWSVLTDLTKKTTANAVLPVFNAQQQGMHQTVQRIQGFMVPMDAKPTQKHFLLTSVPLTCSFCIPGGPESMVEVKAKTPVRYSLEPVVVEGKFNVLPNDPYGLFYRLVEAVPVK